MNRLLRYHRRLASCGPQSYLDCVLLLSLLPFSLLYGLLGLLRNLCYDAGLLSSYRPPVPVISVGNLAAGGTGKTPVVDWLVKDFCQQGRKVAVVSRGYGGRFTGSVGVVSAGDGLLQLGAAEAGDEPCLLARRNQQAIVLIARRRADGVRYAVEHHAVDLVILDDGYQHRAVQRDLDLLLLDATRPFGNCLPLPAGLLREFPQAMRRADLLLLTRAQGEVSFAAEKPVFSSQHRLSEALLALSGEEILLEQLRGKQLFAFAGIAAPESFFRSLRDAGLHLSGELALGDHCCYDAALLQQIKQAAHGCDALITTEKDGVKLPADFFPQPCYQAPMDVQIEDQARFRNELQTLWSR